LRRARNNGKEKVGVRGWSQRRC